MSENNIDLSSSQKRKIEENRIKALERKKAKVLPHSNAKLLKNDNKSNNEKFSFDKDFGYKHTMKVQGVKLIDTGGGFFLEESEEIAKNQPVKTVCDPPALPEDLQPTCEECDKKFGISYLFTTFDYPCCDFCYDKEEKHTLITRTEAKNEYLLKDCDLDKREPPLKFIEKKNPHHSSWGNMKLYLQIQVEKRALEVWESEENLKLELEKREEKRVQTKTKKFQKDMKTLRMNVRSSLFDKTTSANHVHKFGADIEVEDDVYKHCCLTCGFEETYEKM